MFCIAQNFLKESLQQLRKFILVGLSLCNYEHVSLTCGCDRYKSVDWLYCNAGKMPVAGVNWKAFWPLTPANLKYVFTHGGCFVQVEDTDTPDGLKDIFATNAFGHFVLVGVFVYPYTHSHPTSQNVRPQFSGLQSHK